jgi:indolepyruvate ferredoxin oxidoreductase
MDHPIFASKQNQIETELALLAENAAYDVDLTPRTPTFCPGCPHRDSASVLVEVKRDFLNADYMRQQHRKNPIDLVFHGDTGCYTMLMFEPTKDLMHNYSGMGLGGGTGLGIDPFISNKQVVFMGDSTFFHSGQIAISNSLKNGQDITYIILDNKTTAMTGHQTTPGLEKDILGNDTFTQSIDKIIQAIAEQTHIEIVRVNPEAREQYRALLEETILKDGVKIIIADKECGITYHRRNNQMERREIRQNGYLRTKRFINVTADVCENCLECTMATGCPGLTFTETNLGRKIQTDLSWCVADTACTKIYACPSFEEITIIRHEKPSPKLDALNFDSLPLPKIPSFSHSWRAYLAGVGGMGIATSTATLVRAGHREGYRIIFCDKNGLAIRNGGVYSYITYLKEGKNHTSALIPYGKADLILGIDPLEAARGLDPKINQRVGSPHRTGAILNTHKTPTIYTLLGKADFCVSTVEQTVQQYTHPDRYFSFNISEISEKYFGTKLYANIIMIGVAFQRGELPLSLTSLEWAIKETMGPAGTDNWKAFNLGRYIVCHHAELKTKPVKTYHDVIAEKSALLQKQGKKGEQLARTLWRLTTQAITPLHLDEETLRQLALRIYELLLYENAAYAERYIQTVHAAYRQDSSMQDYAATKAVIWNAFKVMAIKDEIYVAYLLTREEKYQLDNERYHVDPSRGDRIVYHHLNRPEFVIAGQKIKFKLRSRDWMLRLMKQAKFLRRLLPEWHKQEKQFREWYLDLVERFVKESSHNSYATWVEILRQPEQVSGYREVRYPKMQAVQQRVEVLMSQSLKKTPAQSLSQG